MNGIYNVKTDDFFSILENFYFSNGVVVDRLNALYDCCVKCDSIRDVKRDQMLQAKAEAEAKHLRPRSRPKPEP